MCHKFALALMVAMLAMAGGIAATGSAAAQAGEKGGTLFFEAVQDVPVMPGLVELQDMTLVFDKPEGRIAEMVARIDGGQDEGAVRQYYARSLPQLGWKAAGKDRFVRGKEQLSFLFDAQDGDSFLRIAVEPR